MPRRCSIAIVNHAASKPQIDLARLQAVVDAALAGDGLERCHLTVLLVDDAESSRLHRQHFGDEDPTDVMSFPDGSTDPESGLRLLGDLAVGVEVAAREAQARGRSIADELCLYVLHGLLHLLGYDDVEPADRAEMWQLQRRLLAGIGIVIERSAEE
jgi:probable rRNA maturation factor